MKKKNDIIIHEYFNNDESGTKVKFVAHVLNAAYNLHSG